MADTRDSKAGTVLVVQQHSTPNRGTACEIVVVPRRRAIRQAHSGHPPGAAGDHGQQGGDQAP